MFRISLLLATVCLANLAWGDQDHEEWYRGRIVGAPLADFSAGKVKIPCVEVKNLDPNLDGKYFDVILDRRGNSMNFELSFSQIEDPALCRSIANFAGFEEDFDDLGGVQSPKIWLSCKQRPGRSKISVEGKGLVAGQYWAEVTSGGNTASSLPKASGSDGHDHDNHDHDELNDDYYELEFSFSSDPEHIAEGATAISPDFIQGTVSAKIYDSNGIVASFDSVPCLNK